jgi:hypothetical protein
MELDPGSIPNDSINGDDPKKCKPSTICYDLVTSLLVMSNHVISAFQQRQQVFSLVNLKDNYGNAASWPCLPFSFTNGPHLINPCI